MLIGLVPTALKLGEGRRSYAPLAHISDAYSVGELTISLVSEGFYIAYRNRTAATI